MTPLLCAPAAPAHLSIRLVTLVGLLTALIVAVSGAFAHAAIDLDLPRQEAEAAETPQEPVGAADPAPLGLRTGDSVDAAQLEAFKARVAWLQSQGLHRGAAIYAHG